MGLCLRVFAAGASLGSPHMAPDQGSPFETLGLRSRASRRVLRFLTFVKYLVRSTYPRASGRRTFARHRTFACLAPSPAIRRWLPQQQPSASQCWRNIYFKVNCHILVTFYSLGTRVYHNSCSCETLGSDFVSISSCPFLLCHMMLLTSLSYRTCFV